MVWFSGFAIDCLLGWIVVLVDYAWFGLGGCVGSFWVVAADVLGCLVLLYALGVS